MSDHRPGEANISHGERHLGWVTIGFACLLLLAASGLWLRYGQELFGENLFAMIGNCF